MTQPLPLLTERPGKVVEDGYYVRRGSCDGCASGAVAGECCTKLVFPINPTAALNPDVVHFWALHGVETKWWGGLPLVVVPIRCSALTEEGQCSLYDQPERPNICSLGPVNPWGGKPLNPACSYEFEWASKE